MLCLILAAMLMLSHGSIGAAVPHVHAGMSGEHHVTVDHDHDGAQEHIAEADADAGAHVDAHHDFGHSELDDNDESDDGVAAHIHLIAGLARVPANCSHPIIVMPAAPLPAATRLLVSREVAPLLEPPTA